ncbi:E3 ubiquitin-protein ligase [Canna indica]|uniref:E3 ubiquitin-protein ligase n=1 Tax=Canna indica TaxID=4628 RepID=A0AAQ3K252_9LILI|nr:E3 ubiquitin-protein ligase [Canna indica]
MGFPLACYSELLLPRALLRVLLLLGYLRRLLLVAFDAVGLGDLLDADLPSAPANSSRQSTRPLLSIERALPAVRYDELEAEVRRRADADGCAVCLCEFERGDEVRRLSNCRHVFHRGCLDRWVIEHEQSTCPLCRTQLVTAVAPGGVGVPDSYYDEYCYYACIASPTQVFLQQLLSSSYS